SLTLVYVSIGVSVLASVLLAAGVVRRRAEIFGEAGAAPASRQPSWPVIPDAGAPAVTGGRAGAPWAGEQPADAEARFANGRPGPWADRDVASGSGRARPDRGDLPRVGPAMTPRGRNGSGRNGPGRSGPGTDGPVTDSPRQPDP